MIVFWDFTIMSTVIRILECLGPEMYTLGGHQNWRFPANSLHQRLQAKAPHVTRYYLPGGIVSYK